jgi:phage host-nuclease inhibitor protein Gam
VAIDGLDEANVALADIAELGRRMRAIEGEMNAQIDTIKREAEERAAPLRDELVALEHGLKAFAEYHKDNLCKDRRNVELTHGSFGFRKSTELKPAPKTTWGAITERIEQLGLLTGLRIRKTPNKEVMREWPDERLTELGVRRVSKDQFWYELGEVDLGSSG